MYEFTYHKVGSVADAAAKVQGADDGVLMAGGMTLLPTMKMRLAWASAMRRSSPPAAEPMTTMSCNPPGAEEK